MLDSITHFFSVLGSEFSHIGVKELLMIFSILIMDAALSGDNSIAISALAQDLPTNLRTRAVMWGMVLAAGLRIVALCCASFIISNPWVQILGGLYLIKLCWSHFSAEEDEADGKTKVVKSLAATLVAIGFLDLSLSLDNVIAVVAMTSNLAVILIGVLASIAMLAVATQVTRWLMGRYPSLEHAAYIILAFLGLVMLVEHTSEFILWAYEKCGSTVAHPIIAALKFDVGDMGEIIGVGCIVAFAIITDEIKSRRNKSATSVA
jgi:YkoY family integral membrane protein